LRTAQRAPHDRNERQRQPKQQNGQVRRRCAYNALLRIGGGSMLRDALTSRWRRKTSRLKRGSHVAGFVQCIRKTSSIPDSDQ
jgi:hypothetical protein